MKKILQDSFLYPFIAIPGSLITNTNSMQTGIFAVNKEIKWENKNLIFNDILY